MGATGYSLPQIAALTFPQFALLLEGIGPMLYIRLRPQLEANWGNVGVDEARKLLKRHRDMLAGAPLPNPTPEERDRAEAYRIVHSFYLGEPEDAPTPQPRAEPLPIPRETAQAIVEAARAKLIPEDIFGEIVPIWRSLLVTAEESPR